MTSKEDLWSTGLTSTKLGTFSFLTVLEKEVWLANSLVLNNLAKPIVAKSVGGLWAITSSLILSFRPLIKQVMHYGTSKGPNQRRSLPNCIW